MWSCKIFHPSVYPDICISKNITSIWSKTGIFFLACTYDVLYIDWYNIIYLFPMTLKFQVNNHLLTCCTSVELAIICNLRYLSSECYVLDKQFQSYLWWHSLKMAVCNVGSLIVDVFLEMCNLHVNRIVGGKFWLKNLP